MRPSNDKDGSLLASRLAYHLRCLREDATEPAMSALERLALVRDRVERIREIRGELEAAKVMNVDRRAGEPR
jgi:hypothetical protein